MAISALSCTSPFSARESEPPTESLGTFITPTQPEIVLLNIETSYNEQIITNYDASLDSSFFFRYDYLQSGGDSDTGWSRMDDIGMTDKLFSFFRSGSSSLAMSLTMREFDQPDYDGDTMATLYREYELVKITGVDTAEPDTVVYRGTAEFQIVETGVNLWALRKWTDRHLQSGDQSWADFKYGYR
jgi:hypothetical protein